MRESESSRNGWSRGGTRNKGDAEHKKAAASKEAEEHGEAVVRRRRVVRCCVVTEPRWWCIVAEPPCEDVVQGEEEGMDEVKEERKELS
ncbi:uncharacterized protein DS421_18g615210 [Arachis hypogaea]|nr:uncharacterized protein DS421_18g615210 [Arachis hypogaea]